MAGLIVIHAREGLLLVHSPGLHLSKVNKSLKKLQTLIHLIETGMEKTMGPCTRFKPYGTQIARGAGTYNL